MIFVRELIMTVVVFLVTETRVVVGVQGCNGSTQTIDLSFTRNGTIYSPGYPSYYSNYEECQWLIKARYGEKVLIYFTAFDLEDCDSCDSVEIFDGDNNYAPSLSKSSGSVLPLPAYSTGRDMYMQFKSDWSHSGQGFVAHYRALSSSSGCPSIVPGASAGVIYSPNFPWNYQYVISACDWSITVPWSKMIKLQFTAFEVGPSYAYCYDYVEVQNNYGRQIAKYCGSDIPPSVTWSGSIRVRFRSDYSSAYVYSGFMAFYQIRYSFPTETPSPYWTTYPYHWTTYPYHLTTYPPVYSPSAKSIYTCKPHSQTILSVKSSSSLSIASSPDIDGYYPTSLPGTTCNFKIDTTKGFILELSFEKMSISSCTSCSCGYVKVKDGTSSTSPLLGTFCSENHKDVVTSKGNHMFVEYYASRRDDTFKATISSKKGTLNVAGIVVPLVIALVLFTIIFVIIKCTRIRRSTGPTGQSRVNDVPLQPLPHNIQLPPPTTQTLLSDTEHGQGLPQQSMSSPSTSQSLSPNTGIAPPHYSQPFATAADPFPPSTDYSQGVRTNMSLGDGNAQL